MGRDASDTLGPVPGWGATYAIAAKFQNVNFHHFDFERYICTTVHGWV